MEVKQMDVTKTSGAPKNCNTRRITTETLTKAWVFFLIGEGTIVLPNRRDYGGSLLNN